MNKIKVAFTKNNVIHNKMHFNFNDLVIIVRFLIRNIYSYADLKCPICATKIIGKWKILLNERNKENINKKLA